MVIHFIYILQFYRFSCGFNFCRMYSNTWGGAEKSNQNCLMKVNNTSSPQSSTFCSLSINGVKPLSNDFHIVYWIFSPQKTKCLPAGVIVILEVIKEKSMTETFVEGATSTYDINWVDKALQAIGKNVSELHSDFLIKIVNFCPRVLYNFFEFSKHEKICCQFWKSSVTQVI